MLDNKIKTLLQTVSPCFMKIERPDLFDIPLLYQLAEKNGLAIQFYDKLDEPVQKSFFKPKIRCIHYEKLLKAAENLSALLEKNKHNFVIVKTIRPYREDTTDVDIINLSDYEDYNKIGNLLINNGYLFIERGPHETGYRSPEGIDIDLYNEISANRIIFLDKRTLVNFKIKTLIGQKRHTYLLTPEADLILLVGHSAIKEHYTLGCLITTLHYINNPKFSINRFIKLAKINKLTVASKWYISITALLCKSVYNQVPNNLSFILDALGGIYVGATRTFLKRKKPPYICDPLTLLCIFLEKRSEKLFLRSIGSQILLFLHPDAASTFRLKEKIFTLIGI